MHCIAICILGCVLRLLTRMHSLAFSASRSQYKLAKQGDFVVHRSEEGHYGAITMMHEGQLYTQQIVRKDGGEALKRNTVVGEWE